MCRFVGALRQMLQPAVIVETGVGAGKITAELGLSDCEWWGFEADPAWRPDAAQPAASPTAGQVAAADLVILDSDWVYRFSEHAMWIDHGKPGSTCFIHDAGNGHPRGLGHHQMGHAIVDAGIGGVFLRNPRGSWVGQHP